MPQEIEAKFLQVNVEKVRAKLREAGAVCEHPMRLMRRELFDYPDGRMQRPENRQRLRLRDEGDKITFTYKRSAAGSNYAHELETTVGSYEQTKEIMLAIGLEAYSYQESKRETWQFGEVEVVIDEWPWTKPYIEIEGPSEQSIQAAAAKLGFDWNDAAFGSADTVYRAEYPGMGKDDSIGYVAQVTFDAPVPEYLKERMA